jgi:hypothetical protein
MVYSFIYIMNQKICIYKIIFLLKHSNTGCKLDVHGSVHCNINLIERTNKMQPSSRIHSLFQCFLIAQHVSDDTPPIIRSSINCNFSLWFYICFWLPTTKNVCKTRGCNYSSLSSW